MSTSFVCPSCGAAKITRREGMFVCTYCGETVIPRLEPGMVCMDSAGGIACGRPAKSMCRGCASPLCDSHDAPDKVYWDAPLHWRRVCPEWDDRHGIAWERLTATSIGLPVTGFEPFLWKNYDNDALYLVGELEREIIESVKRVVSIYAGDVYETGVCFECICTGCLEAVTKEAESAVGVFASRYRQTAFVDRLAAIRSELAQGLRYVREYMEFSESAGGGVSRDSENHPVGSLSLWQERQFDISRRLKAAEKLAASLASGN